MVLVTGGNTIPAFPFAIGNAPQTTPFTMRDATTFLEYLETLGKYVTNTLRPEFLKEIERIISEFNDGILGVDATLDNFLIEIERRIMVINNRVGPEGIQRRTLTADLPVLIDAAWPNAHPIRFQVTQDSIGGHTLIMGPNITGELVLNPSPGAMTEFRLVPTGGTEWTIESDDSVTAGLIYDRESLTYRELDAQAFVRPDQTEIFVDPVNGDDTYGGNDPDDALKTVTAALARIENNPGATDTAWLITLTAGVYRERVTASTFTPFALNVTIRGPRVGHPLVPLVTFTEGNGAQAAAMKFENPNLRITVKDIKFIGYNGTTSSAGINSAYGEIATDNVHAELCFYGVSSIKGNLTVPNGIFTNNGRTNLGTGNGAGVRSLMLNRHYIGNQGAGTLSGGPLFRDNRYGFYAQENCTGHVDWCTFEDNESAIVLRVNSRGNITGSSFQRNTTAVAADSNSHVFVSEDVAFGTGGNVNSQTIATYSGSQATTSRAIAGTDLAYGRSANAVYGKYDAQTVTTATFILDRTLRAPWWNDTTRIGGTAPKRLKITAYGTLVGDTGTKQLILRLGTRTATITFSATEEGPFTYTADVLFVSPTRQIIGTDARRNLGETPRVGVVTTNQDMASDTRITVEAIPNGSDTIVIEYIELEAG